MLGVSMSSSKPSMFVKLWCKMLCWIFHMAELPPTKSRTLPITEFTRLLELKAPWLASCMTFKPMPASPKPMTISATQNPQPVPVAPNVINPHGTKNAASITAVLRYMRQSPWRDFPVSLKYASTRARRALLKSDWVRLKRTIGICMSRFERTNIDGRVL